MAAHSFKCIDLSVLRRAPRLARYVRYPLRHSDFRERRERGRLLGHFAAKPLHGRLTAQRRVDRSAGYNGQVAIIFIPALARTARAAQLVLTPMPRAQVSTASGRRHWPAIRAAAERALRRGLQRA